MANEVFITVRATEDGLRGQVKAFTDEAAAGQAINVRLKVDPANITQDIQEGMMRAVAAAGAEGGKFRFTAEMDVKADAANIDNAIDEAVEEAARSGVDEVKIKAILDDTAAKADAVTAARELQRAFGDVKVAVKFDPANLSAPAHQMAQDWERELAGITETTDKLNYKLISDTFDAKKSIDDAFSKPVAMDSDNFLLRMRAMFSSAKGDAAKGGEDTGSAFSSGFGQSVKDMGNLLKGMGQLFTPGGNTGLASLGAAGSATGISTAVVVVGALVTSLEALAAAAPIAVAGMVGLGAAATVVKIGLTDVTAAINTYYQAQDAVRGKSAEIAAQANSTKDSLISANQAVQDANRSLAQAYLSASDQMISANEAVKQADQSVADAKRNATSQMITANENYTNSVEAEATAERTAADSLHSALETQARSEDSLAQAQLSELRAQQNLTDARQQAQRTIEDLNNKVIDSQIAQQQATEGLENAQIALNQARSGGGGDPEAAATALAAAQQHLNEVTLDYQRAQQDAAKANEQGVSGAKNVVSAQDSLISAQNQVKDATQAVADADTKVTETLLTNSQNVEDAKQKVTDAQRNLTNTEITTNQQIADAEQKASDARRARDQAQITSDNQITQAEEAVGNAFRARTQAQLAASAATESATGSLALYNAELADLAPNAQEFVKFVTSMHDNWETFQRSIQQNLFAGVTADLKTLATDLLPTVEGGATKVAAAINSVVHLIAQWLGQKDTVQDIGTIFDNISQTIKNIGPGIVAVLDIFMQLITVGSGELPGMAGGFSQAAEQADQFVRKARDTGQLKQWIDQGKQALHDLWQIAVNVVDIFNNLSGAKGPNAGFLNDLVTLTGDLDKLAYWVGVVYNALQNFSDKTYTWGQDLKHNLWDFIANPPPKPDLGHFFDSIGDGVSSAWRTVTGSSFWHFLTTPPPHPDWGGLFSGIGGAFEGVWHDITNSRLWHWLTTPPAPPDWSHIFDSLWNGFRGVYNAIANAWNSLSFQMPSIDLFGWHTPSFWVGVPQLPTYRAAGGPGGGLTLLGEQGPELVRLPSGSQVMPAANTAAALGQPAQQINVVLEWHGQGDLFDIIRQGVRVRGGNVQKALGH